MKLIFKRKKLDEIEFPKTFHFGDLEYKIEVHFSKKRNSSVVERDGILIFRLSSYLSNRQAEEHFDSLLRKISLKLGKKKNTSILFRDIVKAGSFVFAGEKYFIEKSVKRGVRLRDNTFYFNDEYDLDIVKKRIINKLVELYSPRIEKYIRVLNNSTYGFKIGEVSLKYLNSKWGHCTGKNDIMINLKLLNSPIEVLNYVIYHELSHVKHKNHSDNFWREVQRFCPNHKKFRKYLKDKPPEVFQLAKNVQEETKV